MDDDLAFAGAARHAELVASGELSSRELTELFLGRIARLDPQLNAYRVVRAEQARAEADQADARRRGGDARPLLGVPIAVKDDVDVAGEVTAFGCDVEQTPKSADHEVVRRLREAGAVILGKTNVPELMITPFTESPTFGVTRNPWDHQRTSGGSSGGSATAVAAGLASAALGSDGAGSIRIPSACTGLFGLKPQRGRVPTAPDVEPFQGMTVFGPLVRRTEDAALIMRAVSDAFPPVPEPRPLRIAVSVALPLPGVKADAEQLEGIANVSAALRDAGHTVFDKELDYGMTMGNRVLSRFLRGTGDKALEVGHPERLSGRARGISRIGRTIPTALAARAARAAADDALRLGAIFSDADLVLTPVFTHRVPRVREWDRRPASLVLAQMTRLAPYPATFNHTGQPALAVPAGFASDGFPLGAQLVGPPDSEPLLLAAGASLQTVRDWHDRTPAL